MVKESQARHERLTKDLEQSNLRIAALEELQKRPPPETPQQALENRISLYLQYAYEWDNYRGSRNVEGDWARVIDSALPLKKKFSAVPHRLDLGVVNVNAQGLAGLELTVVFPSNLPAEKHPPAQWRPSPSVRNAYGYRFDLIPSNTGFHADGPLFVKPTAAGAYTIRYTIQGKDFKPINGTFVVEFEP